MRISDWSSDVCSSDLGGLVGLPALLLEIRPAHADNEILGLSGQRRERHARGQQRRGNPTCQYTHGLLPVVPRQAARKSEEHTSELQSLMRISYAVFCLKKKNNKQQTKNIK